MIHNISTVSIILLVIILFPKINGRFFQSDSLANYCYTSFCMDSMGTIIHN